MVPVIEININITKNNGLHLQVALQTLLGVLVGLELLAAVVGLGLVPLLTPLPVELELLAAVVGLGLVPLLFPVGLELLAAVVGLGLVRLPADGSRRWCTRLGQGIVFISKFLPIQVEAITSLAASQMTLAVKRK